MTLLSRPFGHTPLTVSALGFGAGHIGSPEMSEAQAGALLNAVLDLGVTLIDTARGYGLSEERIGRHLHHRRHEMVLSTKIGYGIPGYQDWSPAIITAGVDEALRRLQTDYLDIVHFHTCPVEVLQQDEMLSALEATVAAGKVRVPAYSGDNEPLHYAINTGRFASIETSINIADQRPIDAVLPVARARGLGVIAKRPIANAPWRFPTRPVGHYAEVYWERLQTMQLNPGDMEWQALALRFVAFLPGVSSCIVGTSNLDHLHHNAELVAQGPLPEATVEAIRHAFRTHDQGWIGQV
jgi:aryl-alcohol dehydrogenase-like predicted oxidoreductase